MLRVLTVVGARPQFIKAAPVSRALAAAGYDEVLVHTGQHYDHAMSDVFFATLGLLDVALTLDLNDFSLRNVWLMMPMLYYIGLWRAQRRYR